MKSIPALSEPDYRLFVTGYGCSFVLYWVTLLSFGWWMWETTLSEGWVGLVYFCELFPAVVITPYASALADRIDRFSMLRIVLWFTVVTGFCLGTAAVLGVLTPPLLAFFAFIEGGLVGFSQPAFFGLVNRLVSAKNLASGIAFNNTVVQTSFVIGPFLAGLIFANGIEFAPLAFSANALGTLVYLYFLSRIKLRKPPCADLTEPGVKAGFREMVENKQVFLSICLIVCVTLLHRPLINLMPSINGLFDVLNPENFVVLTATYMGGSALGTLYLSSINSDADLSRQSYKWVLCMIVLLIGLFCLLEAKINHLLVVLPFLFFLGLSSPFVWTANTIVLQKRTPEGLRSRVLGNSFMISRALGAISVVAVGGGASWFGLAQAMYVNALFVLLLLLALIRFRKKYIY